MTTFHTDEAKLDAEIAKLRAELAEIHERNGDNALSGGDEKRWQNISRAIDKRQAEKDKLARDRVIEGIGTARAVPTDLPPDFGTPNRAGSDDRGRRTIDELHRSGLLPDHAAERAERLIVDSPNGTQRSLASRWAERAGDRNYLGAFTKLLADPTRGHMLWSEAEQTAYQRVAELDSEMRAMSTGTNAGGEMIPLTLDPTILLTGDGSINPLRRVARVVQTVTNKWQGVTSAGTSAEWKTEAAEASEASLSLASKSIDTHFGSAFVPYSYEVGMDAVDFVAELSKVLVDAADQLQATAYTTGDGSGEPTGVIHALDGGASEVDPATAETFASADVYKVQNELPPRFQPRAQWAAALPTINTMAQMETTNGARLFPELGDGRLLRRQINELSNMRSTSDINAAATEDNHLLLYGDFDNFVIVDRIGTRLEIIPHLFGTTNGRPTGQRGAHLWFRTGSDVTVINAFRVLNVATTA